MLQDQGSEVEEESFSFFEKRREKSLKEKFFRYLNTFLTAFLIISAIYLAFLIVNILQDEERKNLLSAPGDFYKDYLGEDYSKIMVEFDFIEGYMPDAEALKHFKNVLERECRKEIFLEVDDAIPKKKEKYSIEDINDLEVKYRDLYRGGDQAVMYFLYLNGEFSDGGEEVAGFAYHGSSVVIFAEKIENASGLRISKTEVERAVLVHEAGHLLGLVEINYKSDYEHQDKEHEHHCTHTDEMGHHDCVMFWKIETSDVGSFDSYYNQVVGDVPNDFCEYCKADLEKQRQRS